MLYEVITQRLHAGDPRVRRQGLLGAAQGVPALGPQGEGLLGQVDQDADLLDEAQNTTSEHVITSYSIHYTKLYDRGVQRRRARHHHHHHGAGDEGAAWRPHRDLAAAGRITSYNVCYTKLLRVLPMPGAQVGEKDGAGHALPPVGSAGDGVADEAGDAVLAAQRQLGGELQAEMNRAGFDPVDMADRRGGQAVARPERFAEADLQRRADRIV